MTGIAMPPGDPDLLEAAAAKLTSAASSWGDLASTTSRAAESIRADAGWTGAAADQQEAFHAALRGGIARGEAPLTSVATAVRGYAGYLRAAQQKVATANSATGQAQATGNPAYAQAATSAQLDAQTSLTQLDNAGNRAAAAVAAADDDSKGLFSPDGPLRSVIERIHTGLGAVGADGIFWAMGKGADSAKEFMKDLTGKSGTEEGWLEDMLRDAQESGEPWTEVSARWMAKSDAAEAFGSQFLQDTTRAGVLSAGLRMAGAPLAIAGDVSTMINPAQSGTMGDADRVVAGGNAVLGICQVKRDIKLLACS
jgi:hypothetical protein